MYFLIFYIASVYRQILFLRTGSRHVQTATLLFYPPIVTLCCLSQNSATLFTTQQTTYNAYFINIIRIDLWFFSKSKEEFSPWRIMFTYALISAM